MNIVEAEVTWKVPMVNGPPKPGQTQLICELPGVYPSPIGMRPPAGVLGGIRSMVPRVGKKEKVVIAYGGGRIYAYPVQIEGVRPKIAAEEQTLWVSRGDCDSTIILYDLMGRREVVAWREGDEIHLVLKRPKPNP